MPKRWAHDALKSGKVMPKRWAHDAQAVGT